MRFGTQIRREAAFTLAEVLAALALMAIVIPVAVEALHVASTAGEIAARKAEAARVAARVLDENIIMGSWNGSGTIQESGHDFRWTLKNARWTEDAMQLLTAEVTFTAHERQYSVRLNTLVSSQ